MFGPDSLLHAMQSMAHGEWLDTPQRSIRIQRLGQWYVIENKLLRSKRFYSKTEDVILHLFPGRTNGADETLTKAS